MTTTNKNNLLRYLPPFLTGGAWAWVFIFLLTACESQLDIVPKGKVTLGTVDELELLLNQEYAVGDMPADELGLLCGETLGMFDQVSAVLAQTNTCKYAYMTFDESVDRASLTTQDARYSGIYKYVNYMNVIINGLPDASGDASRKPALEAEARVMRAYLHWLAATIYARQYDATTAATDGGIAYVTSTEVTETKQKLTLAETYSRILDDVSDAVIAALPASRGDNVVRGDCAWGNAVRAMVLFQMKRYAEALPYAQEAIRLRPQIFDRSTIKTSGTWTQDQSTENNFLYMGGAGPRVSPFAVILSKETWAMFDPNDYVLRYETTNSWSETYGKDFSGIDGVPAYMGFGAQCNMYGLTSEQLHFVAAECLIRTGSILQGLQLIDKVQAKRIDGYVPAATTNPTATEAQAMAILQRAKWIECIATPFNFMDMKRWNSEPAYSRIVTRNLGSLGTFTLQPTSPLWVMPFPLNATRYNPTLTQNY